MSSNKDTFESWVFRAWSFACGVWRGRGPVVSTGHVVDGDVFQPGAYVGDSFTASGIEGDVFQPGGQEGELYY